MQMSLIAQNDTEYFLRSKIGEGQRQIMKILSIRELMDLIPQQAINQYL
jgi:hypothetical protein